MNETAIQKTILNYLQILENQGIVYAFRMNSFQGRLERRYRTKSGKFKKSYGYIKNSKSGVPDIIVCVKGLFVGLEVKTPKNEQTENQKQAQKDIEKAGGNYFVVRSLEEVEQILNKLLN